VGEVPVHVDEVPDWRQLVRSSPWRPRTSATATRCSSAAPSSPVRVQASSASCRMCRTPRRRGGAEVDILDLITHAGIIRASMQASQADSSTSVTLERRVSGRSGNLVSTTTIICGVAASGALISGDGDVPGRASSRRAGCGTSASDLVRNTRDGVIWPMDVAGGHWFTSSGFRAPASGVIATAVVGALTAWVALRVAYPKRWLLYRLDRPLADERWYYGPDDDRRMITMRRRRDRRHVVRLVLRNAGRRDIAREAFDGSPLTFFLFNMVVDECLHIGRYPREQPKPKVVIGRQTVTIDPVKIAKGQIIAIDLLVYSRRRPATWIISAEQTITDIDIRPQSAYDRQRNPTVVVAGVAAGIGTRLLLGALYPHRQAYVPGVLAVGGITLGALFFLLLVLHRLRRWYVARRAGPRHRKRRS
jgi:hypothetical protein